MRPLSPAPLLLAALAFEPVAPGYASADAQELAIAPAPSREDSIRLHRTARSRQEAFERTRRNHLPWGWGGGGGDCDERIGRFCLTYSDDDAPEYEPPEEHERVVAARERLLTTLQETAVALPGDRWVAGHLVRYLVESKRTAEARDAALRCRAEGWWCDALLGFAAHNDGDAAAADSAFGRMLAAMPERAREEWTDLTPILDRRVAGKYRRLRGDDREAFENRFWTLADPLLQTDGNDLRSEHFSRNLLVAMQDRSETTEDIPWGDDLREILIRFGAPAGWERVRPSTALLLGDRPAMVTHYPDADLDLLPPPQLLDGEFDPTAGVWDESGRRARASYPLPRGGDRLRWFDALEHQVAVFPGYDSALVVVAYAIPEDSLPPEARLDAALAVRTGLNGDPLIVSRADAGASAVLALQAPPGSALVSAEVLAREEKRAARARFGAQLPALVPGVLAASDLLLLEDGVTAETREEALRHARGSLRLRSGETVGVYWEMYSPAVPWPATVEMSLRLVDGDAGWLRRMAERAGVVQQVQPIRLVWAEGTAREEVIPRTLSLQVPDEISPGTYHLELSVTATGRAPLVVRRTVQVER